MKISNGHYMSAKSVSIIDTNQIDDAPVSGIAIVKYKKTINYIEDELYTTLAYLNNQLLIIDEQTNGDSQDPAIIVPFNRNVYDSKKQIVEQKLVALRSLASVAMEQVKIAKDNNENTITNITDLFQ